jgi:ParB/RepB/Spo0J family partition protein
LTTTPLNITADATQRLPLARIVPSPFNPRKRIKEGPLGELADSIKLHGVMQPILVRPIAPPVQEGDPPTHSMFYEIVAGERRWRASTIAGVDDIPVVVRELTPMQAMELQAVENAQREDPHPIEEAEGFDHLMNPPTGETGYTLDQVAKAVGKSVAHVRESVALCRLIPDARDAFFADALTKGTALLIARMPVTQQAPALKKLLAAIKANGGTPLSNKAASELLQAQFMLRLASAPFDKADAQLLPDAGACTTCPKRTGANPDLFADVPNADTCTDPDCHTAKCKAASEARVAKAQADGVDVLRGADARAALKFGDTSDALTEYVYLDKPLPELTASDKTLRKLLGPDFKAPVLYEHPATLTVREVATVDTIKKVLDAKGLLPKPAKGVLPKPTNGKSKSSSQAHVVTETERKTVIAQTWRTEIFKQLHHRLTDGTSHGLTTRVRQLIAQDLTYIYMGAEDFALLSQVWGRPFEDRKALDSFILSGASDDDLDNLIIELLYISCMGNAWGDDATILAIATDPELGALPVAQAQKQATDVFDGLVKAAEACEAASKLSKAPKASKASKAIHPSNVPPPAGESSAPKTAGKAKAPTSSAAAPAAKKTSKKDAGAAPSAPAQGTPASAGSAGKHWVGQHVRIKASKKIGPITAIRSSDGLLTVDVTNRAEGVAWPFPLTADVASCEVEVLEGQVQPTQEQ